MVDIIEIYVHWYAGRSKSQVGASLGVDRKTVRKYLAPAEAPGIAPGGPPMGEADWAKLIKTWFPGQAGSEPDHLARDRPAPRLHQDPAGDHHRHHDPPTAA